MTRQRHTQSDDRRTRSKFNRRYETLGAYPKGSEPKGSGNPRRTYEQCRAEIEEHERLGIEIICRPTWEGIEQARREIEETRER